MGKLLPSSQLRLKGYFTGSNAIGERKTHFAILMRMMIDIPHLRLIIADAS